MSSTTTSGSATERPEGRKISGRKRCSSQQEEEGSGERRVGKAPPLKCKFSAEDVEDIACNEYLETLSLVSSLASSSRSMVVATSRSSKWDLALLPQLFYTDDPDMEEEGGAGEGGEVGGVKREGGEGDDAEWEIQEESLDIITQAPLWMTRGPEVIEHLPPSTTDTPGLPLGFDFPPVMSRHIELLVHNHWEKWKREGLIKDGSDPETQAKFHSTVADAHLYLVNLIKAYIRRRNNAGKAMQEVLSTIREAVRDVASQANREPRDDSKLTLLPGEPGPAPTS